MSLEIAPETSTRDATASATSEANERWQRTAVAAFYRAQARGFAPGGELDDWLAAERELSLADNAAAATVVQAKALPVKTARAARKRPPVKRAPRSRKPQA